MMQELRRGSIVDVRQKLVSRPLRPVDPDQWEGLNNTFVDSRYPGKQAFAQRPFLVWHYINCAP